MAYGQTGKWPTAKKEFDEKWLAPDWEMAYGQTGKWPSAKKEFDEKWPAPDWEMAFGRTGKWPSAKLRMVCVCDFKAIFNRMEKCSARIAFDLYQRSGDPGW